ncbi:PREDICTED: uncharacterized protein LOC104709170 [Camelina sativa]|uniref:Uncharacterized protein LOC104709170 n=1 Tax=Camelina sativa TaxID=90675 RepID=A0ABM0TCD2_CAMSA|nr:PREDICTED: uncharacterized protein LOC104709170 [Camelina sativa]
MLSGALAISERLASRGCGGDVSCMRCGSNAETICHMLFVCPVARQAFALANIPSPVGDFSITEVDKNWEHLLTVMQDDEVPCMVRAAIPWVLWGIWKHRNTVVFQGKNGNIRDLITKAFEDSNQWQAAQSLPAEAKLHYPAKQGALERKWCKPVTGFVKCNIGSSWYSKSRLSGGAWIVRDEYGQVLYHARDALPASDSQFLAALQCCSWSIEALCILQVAKVEIALDNAMVIDAINSPTAWPRFSLLLSNIHENLSKFGSWRATQVASTANSVAMAISKSVTRDGRLQSYLSLGGPSWLHHQVRSEAS